MNDFLDKYSETKYDQRDQIHICVREVAAFKIKF